MGTTYNRHVDFTFDPAGGIASSTGSSDSYAWTGHYAINRSYTANGLNQYTAAGSITPTYDSRGNLTSAGSVTYGYNSENRLISASGGITLSYDPFGRLYETAGASTTRMGYDDDRMIAEYNSSNTLQRRYVYGPGTDELLVWYEGANTSTPHYYHTDERGSVIALSNGSGALTDINRYDEYGIPGSNAGRFQYTGQQWLSDLGMYYYRNRIYSPTLGRFLQTDPIGLGGGMNLYAYVGNNPVNFTDPLGLGDCHFDDLHARDITVCGHRPPPGVGGINSFGGNGNTLVTEDNSMLRQILERLENGEQIIVVTARRSLRRAAGRLGTVLGQFADDYLRPPEGRRPGETYAQCVRRLSGPAAAALGIAGGSGVGAGGPWLGYPGGTIGGGGRGTSLISAASRSLGRAPLGFQMFGSGNLGGVVGRGLSRVSVVGGAALGGIAVGATIGALQRCRQ